MKHLKIFSAVLLFSFLGSLNNQVCAQTEPTENAGYWSRNIHSGQYLQNGDFRAKLKCIDGNATLVIYKKSDNSIVRSTQLGTGFTNATDFNLYVSAFREDNFLVCGQVKDASESSSIKIAYLRLSDRSKNTASYLKVLDDTKDATEYAYFQLESDGRFVIYHSTVGMFNSAGTPIIEIL